MSATWDRPLGVSPSRQATQVASADWSDSRYQAFMLMRIGYTVLPIAMGIDKFFNEMVYWPKYLAGWLYGGWWSAQSFMYFVGAVECLAGVLLFLKPRYAAYIVAGWLLGIVVNLWSYSGWYDVSVRDFGLMLGALALGRLAAHYDKPLVLFGKRLP